MAASRRREAEGFMTDREKSEGPDGADPFLRHARRPSLPQPDPDIRSVDLSGRIPRIYLRDGGAFLPLS